MTRHQGFDVRVAPEVERELKDLAHGHGHAAVDARRIRQAIQRLEAEGTWANGVRKMQSLALWELRAGDYRLFFCQLRGTRRLAVGAMARKSRQRLPMRHLKRIETEVRRWREELEEMA